MNSEQVFLLFAAALALATLGLFLRPSRIGSLAAARETMPSFKTALGLAALIPLAAGGLYAVLGNRAALQGPDNGAQQAPHQTGGAEVERMVRSLAGKLEKNPDDAKGWAMLARSFKVMGRYGEAEQAFAKAGSVVEGSADVLTEYADVVAMRNGGRMAGKPEELVKKALALEPDHPTALWMAGTAAYQRKDYRDARRDWERLLKQLPAQSADGQVIRANLDELRILGGEAAKPGAVAGMAVPAIAAKGDAAAGAKAGAPSAVRGTVRLAPGMRQTVSPDDAVFVFARPLDGSRMPLAVLRARVADLPMDFVLDSSNAMNPDRTLEKAGIVVVEARVSRHGDAKSRPGDLLGQRDRVKVGSKGVAIVIDQVM
jgi:cytochrome c-type biogenesis protein CcmH